MISQFKPAKYSTVSPYLIVNGADATIDFLKRVFGAIELRRFSDESGKLRKVCKTFLPDCRDGTIAT